MLGRRAFYQANPCRVQPTKLAMQRFFTQLVPSQGVLHGPLFLERSSGFVGILVTEHAIITLLSDLKTEIVLELTVDKTIEPDTFGEKLLEFVEIKYLKSYEVTDGDFSRTECQEPRCSMPAAKIYNGMHLCKDHYEQWQERSENLSSSYDHL